MQKHIRLIKNIFLDIRYGGKFLGGTIKTKFAALGAKNTSNSDYGTLNYIFADIVKPNDVLVDVGCGKGRVINFWLSKRYENNIIGLELDNRVANFTKKRLKPYKKVSIISGDAIKNLPSEGTIFYLYNPFDEGNMIRFRERIWEIFSGSGSITIVYYNCIHLNVFENDSRWVIKEIKNDYLIKPTVIIQINSDE